MSKIENVPNASVIMLLMVWFHSIYAPVFQRLSLYLYQPQFRQK